MTGDLSRLPRAVQVRIADLPRHLRALESMLAQTTEEAFEAAAKSTDPEVLKRDVYPLERSFELLSNYVAELAALAVEYVGLNRQDAPQNLRQLADRGGVAKSRSEQLIRVNRIRNNLQHQYPDVRARQTWEAAQILTNEILPFVRAYARWFLEQIEDR